MEPAVQQLASWAAEYGYPAVFAAVLAEFLGFPLPSALVLAGAASLSGARLAPPLLVASASAAAVLGDGAWYLAGRLRGERLLGAYCSLTMGSASCTERTRGFFARFGAASLVPAKFVPGLSAFAAPMAGLLRVPLLSFVAWDLLGAVLWSAGFVWLGRSFGAGALTRFHAGAGAWTGRFAAAAAAGAVFVIAFRWLRRRVRGPAEPVGLFLAAADTDCGCA